MVLIPLKRKGGFQTDGHNEDGLNKAVEKAVGKEGMNKKQKTITTPIPKMGMIELNGTLLRPLNLPQPPSTLTLKTELGLFYHDSTDGNRPTLVVGTHEVKGKRVKLKKNLLVCKKEGGNNGNSGGIADSKGGIEILGLVENKYLFDSYPKTIMRERKR